MMRMRGGMVLRMSEMMRLESITTTVTEMAITTAGFSCAVTARQEHTPSTCTRMGLFLLNGSFINSTFFMTFNLYH